MKCKVGDIAIVRGTRYNDGKIVQILEYIGSDDSMPEYSDLWLVDPPLVTRLVYKESNKETDDQPAMWRFVPDVYLHPIRGDLLKEDVSEKDELLERV